MRNASGGESHSGLLDHLKGKIQFCKPDHMATDIVLSCVSSLVCDGVHCAVGRPVERRDSQEPKEK